MKRIYGRQEILVYVLSWLVMAAVPVVVTAQQVLSGEMSSFDWHAILHTWLQMLPFFIAFVVHNWLLAPLLVSRRRVLYACGIVAVVGVFMLYECTQRPPIPHHHDGPPQELRGNRPALPPDIEDVDGSFKDDFRDAPPPILFGQHDLVALIVLMLMLAWNMGTKYYFKQRDDARRLKYLEYERVQQQLSYLRYQINPHFLMNTLNNIHALIDIAPEQAQESIVELSRLLRYVLYDGDHDRVSLQREVDFVQHFMELMRIRYTENVDVCFEVEMSNPSAQLPPLVLIAFVENAFKHGVSYQRASFVHIAIDATETRLHFTCRNSKKPQAEPHEARGGVGLRNVRKRLDLLFADAYRLDITDGADVYSVDLEIPLTS